MKRLLVLLWALCCSASIAGATSNFVINEVVFDSPSTDTNTFVELKGPAGMSMTGYRLAGIKGSDGTTYNTISLDNKTIPASGYFVIAQSVNVPNYNMITGTVDYQNGPNSIQLQQNVGGTWVVIDAVGYKCFTSNFFAGEGQPAAGQTPNTICPPPLFERSMARCPDGQDTDNNRADFVPDANPTPGAANHGNCAPVNHQLSDIQQDDGQGVPVYVNTYVHVQGIAENPWNNWQTTNIEVMITDGTGCADVFASAETCPAVATGDLLDVVGVVSDFSGKTEIEDPIITVVSSGNPLPAPATITTNELAVNGAQYENCLIKIRCVRITGGDAWPPSGGSANVQIDDGSGPTILRINNRTNIGGTPQPSGSFTVVGIGTQFASGPPFSGGFEIQPRSTGDLFLQDCATGACCFADGHCAPLGGQECATQGGSYQGDNTVCNPNPCPQPTGACCFTDGSCQILTQAACTQQGGTYQGNNTSCTPNPCPQPSGACCLPGYPRGQGPCVVESPSQCAAQGGAYQGNGTTCTPNPCAQLSGACCFTDGSCRVATEPECQQQGGTYQGDHIVCDPNPCPQPAAACCFTDGHCTVLTQAQCQSQGGVWQGVNTTCSPNSCPQPPEACCFVDGHCEFVTAAVCGSEGGTPQGVGTLCNPNPCPQPTGACCFSDGHCTILNAADCQAEGGTYQGNGTSCSPNNPCPQPPMGACCIGTQGNCQILTRAQCDAQNGQYQGDGSTCAPNNPCNVTPTKDTTWGKIKSTYR